MATEPAALAAQLRSLAEAVGLLVARVHELAREVEALPADQSRDVPTTTDRTSASASRDRAA